MSESCFNAANTALCVVLFQCWHWICCVKHKAHKPRQKRHKHASALPLRDSAPPTAAVGAKQSQPQRSKNTVWRRQTDTGSSSHQTYSWDGAKTWCPSYHSLSRQRPPIPDSPIIPNPGMKQYIALLPALRLSQKTLRSSASMVLTPAGAGRTSGAS